MAHFFSVNFESWMPTSSQNWKWKLRRLHWLSLVFTQPRGAFMKYAMMIMLCTEQIIMPMHMTLVLKSIPLFPILMCSAPCSIKNLTVLTPHASRPRHWCISFWFYCDLKCWIRLDSHLTQTCLVLDFLLTLKEKKLYEYNIVIISSFRSAAANIEITFTWSSLHYCYTY